LIVATRKKHRAPPVAHPMSAYRRRGEDILIELSLNKIGQLYNSFDPSPFHEKELDSDADAYIFSAVREIGADKPIKLVIDLPPEELTAPGAADIERAIRNHFAYRLQTARRDLRHELQRGRTSVLIGLAFLVGCMATREVALTAVPSAIQRILSEGLLIIGWVAMWGRSKCSSTAGGQSSGGAASSSASPSSTWIWCRARVDARRRALERPRPRARTAR
jgi:hypothetical protein